MAFFRSTTDGNVGSGAADSGNPVKVGGKYSATLPTLADGQRGDVQLDVSGNVRTLVTGSAQTGADGVVNTNLTSPFINTSQTGTVKLLTTAGYVFNGTSWDRMRGNAAQGQVVKPYALGASDWSYAAAALGIVNTATAVTIKAAGGAGIINYITSIDIMAEALGAATELVIRNGAAGTVLWRMKIGTAGLLEGRSVLFASPLKSSAATLLEVCTLTATTTGAVYFNAQGYSA